MKREFIMTAMAAAVCMAILLAANLKIKPDETEEPNIEVDRHREYRQKVSRDMLGQVEITEALDGRAITGKICNPHEYEILQIAIYYELCDASGKKIGKWLIVSENILAGETREFRQTIHDVYSATVSIKRAEISGFFECE